MFNPKITKGSWLQHPDIENIIKVDREFDSGRGQGLNICRCMFLDNFEGNKQAIAAVHELLEEKN